MLTPDFEWITKDNGQAIIAQLASCETIALDTEFVRRNTFFPIPALFQISDGKRLYLLDPVTFPAALLVPLFSQPKPLKLVHALREDLIVLHHYLGITPQGLCDTQLLAHLVYGEGTLGLTRMLERSLGIDLPQFPTMLDWLIRPLPKDYLLYSLLDVLHLIDAWQAMVGLAQQRYDLCLQDSQDLCTDHYAAFLQLGNEFSQLHTLADMPIEHQRALHTLICQRDSLAIATDRPKPHIAKTDKLIQWAVQGSNPLQQKLTAPLTTPPFQPIGLPISGADRTWLKKHQQTMGDWASDNHIPASYVTSKKLLSSTFLAVRDQLPIKQYCQGWRKPVLLEPIQEYLGRQGK